MIANFFTKARLLATRRYAALGDYPWIDPSQFSSLKPVAKVAKLALGLHREFLKDYCCAFVA